MVTTIWIRYALVMLIMIFFYKFRFDDIDHVNINTF